MGSATGKTMAKIALVWVGALLLARPALAQMDLAGEWALRQHEDAQSRGAGRRLASTRAFRLTTPAA
jgi:hypothetical protein